MLVFRFLSVPGFARNAVLGVQARNGASSGDNPTFTANKDPETDELPGTRALIVNMAMIYEKANYFLFLSRNINGSSARNVHICLEACPARVLHGCSILHSTFSTWFLCHRHCGVVTKFFFPFLAAPVFSGGQRHDGTCLTCIDTYKCLPATTVESYVLLLLADSREGWVHGEADAVYSHELGCSDLRKSQTAATPT